MESRALSATARPSTSTAPPGGNGTMSRSGLSGYCANAVPIVNAAAKAKMIARQFMCRFVCIRISGQVLEESRIEISAMAFHNGCHRIDERLMLRRREAYHIVLCGIELCQHGVVFLRREPVLKERRLVAGALDGVPHLQRPAVE